MSGISLNEFQDQFDALQGSEDRHFDGVRFAFLQAMSRRLAQPRLADNKVLLTKAWNGLQEYKADLKRASERSQAILESVATLAPSEQEHANSLAQKHHFQQLVMLQARLQRSSAFDENIAQLRELVAAINSQAKDSTHQVSPSMDKLLSQQEHELRHAAPYSLETKKDGRGEQLEMQSMKYFRETMKYFDVDNLVAQAINDQPANPGPHNPQMLAVKALANMQNLSPHYLRRFVTYIETMLWMEKNASKLVPKKKL